jgi:hypothetical protein
VRILIGEFCIKTGTYFLGGVSLEFVLFAFLGNILNSPSSTTSNMAAPIEERISVPIDDPNADTEW